MAFLALGMSLESSAPHLANFFNASGSSGYGRFHFENFTDKRVIVMHPLGRKYYLVDF